MNPFGVNLHANSALLVFAALECSKQKTAFFYVKIEMPVV